MLGDGDVVSIAWNGTATTAGATCELGFPVDVPSSQKNADSVALKANSISIVPLSDGWRAAPTKALTGVVKAQG